MIISSCIQDYLKHETLYDHFIGWKESHMKKMIFLKYLKI